MAILLAGLIIGVIFMIHELGHYMVARIFNTPVTVFSIGFGPEVFSVNLQTFDTNDPVHDAGYRLNICIPLLQRKTRIELCFSQVGWDRLFRKIANALAWMLGTNTWRLAIIPLASFVKLEAIQGKPRPVANTAIAVAGPAANFASAFVAVLLLGYVGNQHTINDKTSGTIEDRQVVVQIKDASGSHVLISEDVIVRVNGQAVTRSSEVATAMAKLGNSTPTTIVFNRDDRQLTTTLSRADMENVALSDRGMVYRTFTESARLSLAMTGYICNTFVTALHSPKISHFSGPVGILSMVNTESKSTTFSFTLFFVLISIVFGVFNLVPIPPLDGGKILVVWIGAIHERTGLFVERKIGVFTTAAMVSLVVWVTCNDLLQL